MVIDDQAVVRQGFVSLINTVADMEVIAQGVNGQQALELYREHQPDITLMDLRMPVMGGVDAIAKIRQEFPDAKIIVKGKGAGLDDPLALTQPVLVQLQSSSGSCWEHGFTSPEIRNDADMFKDVEP